jgi:hypothetical protein
MWVEPIRALHPYARGGVPFLSRSIPEKERRGGRVDLNAAPREQIPPPDSGRLMRSGRRATRAGGSVGEGRYPVTEEAACA